MTERDLTDSAGREHSGAKLCTCNKQTAGACFCTDAWPVATAPTFVAEEHVHEWSALWSHFGEYGDQDAHFHVCLTENPHPAPGYRAKDCRVMLVGKGRSCVDGQEHEVRVPGPRVRHA